MKHPAIDFKHSTNGQIYFVVKAKNNKILATSELYETNQAAMKGAQSLISNIAPELPAADAQKSLPPRSNIAIRLSTLKALGIETMADVAAAIEDGRLTQGDIDGG